MTSAITGGAVRCFSQVHCMVRRRGDGRWWWWGEAHAWCNQTCWPEGVECWWGGGAAPGPSQPAAFDPAAALATQTKDQGYIKQGLPIPRASIQQLTACTQSTCIRDDDAAAR